RSARGAPRGPRTGRSEDSLDQRQRLSAAAVPIEAGGPDQRVALHAHAKGTVRQQTDEPLGERRRVAVRIEQTGPAGEHAGTESGRVRRDAHGPARIRLDVRETPPLRG